MAYSEAACRRGRSTQTHTSPAPDSSVVQSHSDSAIPPAVHNSSHAYGSSTALPTTETGQPSLPISSSRSPSFVDAPFFIDDKNPQQSLYIPSTANGGADGESAITGTVLQTPDVDPQILEALRGKERLFVLKLAELFESLIKERRCVLFSVPPA